MGNINTGKHQFWFKAPDGTGVRLFPRCGSTTLQKAWDLKQCHKGEWLELEDKVIVVRDPLERLISTWHGALTRLPTGAHVRTHRDWGSFHDFWDFARRFVLAKPDAKRDWHVQTYGRLLEDYWPETGELWTLNGVSKYGTESLPAPEFQLNQSRVEADANVSLLVGMTDEQEGVYEQLLEVYAHDFELYYAACSSSPDGD
ncbi:MAG: hypothetical protein QNJ97_17905 [Myxococcota bacterium]|nr:hypothetical protein [Myxococcota bacterium]